MHKLVFRLLVLCLLISGSAVPAGAQTLLGSDFSHAAQSDFISHFGFGEKQQMPGFGGLLEHVYADRAGSMLLGLGTNSDGKIVHMKFIMPRSLIDDPQETLAGRDLVMSFVRSVISGSDYMEFAPLIDEINVRDLDLHPVDVKAAKFADTGKPIPQNAYKVGSGPMKKGDRLTFIDKMPVLTKTPSEMYSAFAGRVQQSGMIGSNCRLSFQNGKQQGDSLLSCDAWNEAFWKKHVEPSQSGSASSEPPESPEKHLSQAIELVETRDPVKSRMAEKELEEAEKLGSTDFRIPALKACASIQVGRQIKGLAALKQAIEKLKSTPEQQKFLSEMKATAESTQKKLDSRPPAKVPPEKRSYTIPPGTSAVIADKDESTGVVTMAISGGHDPDGGAQDGEDDGIIQVPWKNINQPSEVYRAK